MEFSNIVDLSLILAVLGVAIIYFGKMVLKSRKELCSDTLLEYNNGIFFLLWYLIFPLLLAYVGFSSQSSFGGIQIALIIQFVILIISNWEIHKKDVLNKDIIYLNRILAVVSFFMLVFVYTQGEFFSLCISFLFLFLNLIATSIMDGYERKKFVLNLIIKR